MQSLLPSSHGRVSFQNHPKPNSISSYVHKAKLHQLPFTPSTKSALPSIPSSSSVQLRTKSHHLSSLLLYEPSSNRSRCSNLMTNPATVRKLTLPPLRCGISSNSPTAKGDRSLREWVEWIGEALSTAFPIWVALGCLLGLFKPNSFNWVQPRWTILGITLTMLGMGMTLTLDDLRSALSMPKELLAGFVLQYSVMPISGFLVSKLLNLPSYYAAGLILVACCPGGTASNIVTYIARGNVALSVLMTAASTVSAVIMTPFLTAKLAGQYVAVDAAGLLLSTLQVALISFFLAIMVKTCNDKVNVALTSRVVLLPVLAGAFLNQYFKGLVWFISPLMPPIAVATVAVLCGNAIAQSASAILMSGQQVVIGVSLLHASGFFFGYMLSRILGLDVASSRTISIEVGMQNSVLGVVLATQHFGNPLTAVPCAVSSVCHSIFGSFLAGIWRQSTEKKNGM